MKASLCVGEYCENAYNVEGLDIRVYSMEELCYCLKENAFLLDLSIMNDKLVDWIGEECKCGNWQNSSTPWYISRDP